MVIRFSVGPPRAAHEQQARTRFEYLFFFLGLWAILGHGGHCVVLVVRVFPLANAARTQTHERTHARTAEFTITANHAECNSPFPPHFSQSLLGKNHVESKRELRHDTTPRASDAFPPPGHCRDHPDAMHGKCQVTPIARLAFLDNYSGAASIKLLPIYPVQSIFCSLGHRTCLAHETLANAARTVFLATHVRSGMPSASIFKKEKFL